VPRALAVALAVLATSCTDNHAISPWGDAGRPRLADYAIKPDLDAHVASIDAEAARLGLAETFRVTAKDPRSGDALVAVALEGRDDVGRRLTATRVASPWGVVLARGPHDLRDVRRGSATELLRLVSIDAATEGGPADASVGFAALSDLTRDQTPDLLLRSDDGRLEIWSMTARAGTQVDVRMEVPPTRVVDVDGDGRIDLAGSLAMGAADTLRPSLEPGLTDVATWAGDGFSNATPAAKAFHARHRSLSLAAEATARTDPDRAKRAIEVAWHGILGGGDAGREVAALARKRPTGELGPAFDAYVRRVARIGH
jgi:hypothetical protein